MTVSSHTGRRNARRGADPGSFRPRRRSGFTIVSMIVAVILLTVGLMSLAGANSQTIALQTVSQNRTNAIAIARSYIEQVRTRDPWMIDSESTVKLDGDGTVAATGAFKRTLTVTELRQNLIEIQVRVDFPRSEKPVLLTTLMFRGNGLSGA